MSLSTMTHAPAHFRRKALSILVSSIPFVAASISPAYAAVEVFYDTLSAGRNTFETRVTDAGGSVSKDKLNSHPGGSNTWNRSDYTITTTNNITTNQAFTGSSASNNDGYGIQVTSTADLSTSLVTFGFGSPVNAFALELGDWGTCCYPSELYISFDNGSPILIGSAASSADVPGYTDGRTTFIGAIDDSATFSTIKFWGIASGDVLFVGNETRWAVLRIGALSGVSVLDSTRTLNNSPAYSAASVIDSAPDLQLYFIGIGSDQQISDAATQVLPLLTGATSQVVFNALGNTNRIIQNRLAANRGMSSGDDAWMMDEHAWVKVFGTWHDQDDRGGVTGYDGSSSGLVLGVDGNLNDKTKLGIGFAYGQTDTSSNTNLNLADIDSYQLVGYGSYAINDRTEVNFQADIGLSKTEGERIMTAPVVGTAYSDFDSISFHFGTGIAKTFDLSSRTQVAPMARIDYTRVRADSYTETGNATVTPFLNRVQSDTAEALELGLAASIDHEVSESTRINADLGVAYDTINEAASITSSFVGGGASFTTTGIKPDRWIKRAGLGLTHTLQNGAEVVARYDAEVREDFLDQTASVKVRWAF